MNAIDRYIDRLLLNHDCVVVPGFGGFITHYEEADVDNASEEESVLFPPYRTVRFNQALTEDDGLLVHAYMTAHDTTYIAATQQMQLDLAQLMQALATEGCYTLENIGTLRQDLSGRITLETDEAGIATPGLYGMGSLTVQPVQSLLRQRQAHQAVQQTTLLPIVPAPERKEGSAGADVETVVVRVHRRWIDVAYAAAAAAILFFLLSYPAMRSTADKEDTIVAGLQRSQESTSPSKQATAKQEATPKKSAKPKASKKKPAPAKQPAAAPRPMTHTIVLACYVSERNANIYMDRLAQQGFRECRYDATGKVSRILYSAYPDEQAAQQALHALRGQSREFAEAWVMHL